MISSLRRSRLCDEWRDCSRLGVREDLRPGDREGLVMEFGLPWPEWSGLLREEDLDLSARRAEDDRPRDLSTEPALLGEREEEKEGFFLVVDLD